MKKNLRIVSAAAAALLAVAPVAATVVPSANAAGVTENVGSLTQWGVTVNNNSTVNITSGLQLNTQNLQAGVKQNLTGGITLNVAGSNYNALFAPNYSAVGLYTSEADAKTNTNPIDKATTDVMAGKTYYANMSHVSFNLGKENANKTITVTMPKGGSFQYWKSNQTNDDTKNTDGYVTSAKVFVKSDGTFSLGNIILPVNALDLTNSAAVNFFDIATGQVVTSGNVSMYANAQGKLNTAAVAAAISKKYAAAQVSTSTTTASADVVVSSSDVAAALKALNVTVDANGWFEAPKSFTVNAKASSQYNGATATLPVTVNVPNGKEATPANTATKDVTVMHIAAVYNKEGKQTSADKLRAYNSVKVVSEPVTINGAKFYELADKAADGSAQYIKVSNIDGTSKTLKKNSYIYKRRATGSFYATKASKKHSIKAGTSKTVYGGKLYGNWYRVGKNEYIRARNF